MLPPKTSCCAFLGERKCLALKEMECLRGNCSFYKTKAQDKADRIASQERLKEKGLWEVYKGNYNLKELHVLW